MTEPLKPPKAIIFDVDGVLFDTEPLHRKAWAFVLGEENIKVTDEELMPWTGISCRIMAADVKKLYELRSPSEELVARKTIVFETILRSELKPFPGLKDVLSLLAPHFTLAFATGSTRKDVNLMLNLAGLDGLLVCGTTADDVSNLKPHPETYQKTLSRLNLAPAECAALEDSPTGIQASRGAGLFTLGICSSYTKEVLSKADMIFPTTADACRWLLAL